MKDWTTIQARFLRDSLPVRLGGLAANLSRIRSFACHDANQNVTESLIAESKLFIEWTAPEAEVETAASLVELQIQLAVWHRDWARIWPNRERRSQIAEQSGAWANRILEMSGLLVGG